MGDNKSRGKSLSDSARASNTSAVLGSEGETSLNCIKKIFNEDEATYHEFDQTIYLNCTDQNSKAIDSEAAKIKLVIVVACFRTKLGIIVLFADSKMQIVSGTFLLNLLNS